MVINYIKEIDGLRGISVLLVIFYHVNHIIPNGYIGVDIFFVISGYIITKSIINNKEFNILNFYKRRIRRILPLLSVVILVSYVIGYWLLYPKEYISFANAAISNITFTQNLHYMKEINYFDNVLNKPLVHTWSLAIEEQFYIIFPLLIVIHSRVFKNYNSTIFYITLLILSYAYFLQCNKETYFFSFLSRSWQIISGCTLAQLGITIKNKRVVNTLAALGFTTILLTSIIPINYNYNYKFPHILAVISTLFIIISINNGFRYTSIFLNNNILNFLGKISFSLYLWHWPIIVFSMNYFGNFHFKVSVFVLLTTLLVSTITWLKVEVPFRKIIHYKGITIIFLVFCSSSLIGFKIKESGGLKYRFNDEHILDLEENGERFVTSFDYQNGKFSQSFFSFGSNNFNDKKGLDFFIWGDSHALQMANVFEKEAIRLSLKGKSCIIPSTLPLPLAYNSKESRNNLYLKNEVLNYLDLSKPRVLILIARWSAYFGFNDNNIVKKSYTLSDSTFMVCTDRKKVLSKSLKYLEDFCKQRSIKIYIINQMPESNLVNPAHKILRHSGWTDKIFPSKRSSKQHYNQNKAFYEYFESDIDSSISLVDFAGYFKSDSGDYLTFFKNRSLYRDQDHLSIWGSLKLAPGITKLLQKIALIEHEKIPH